VRASTGLSCPDDVAVSYRAVTAPPYEHLERATAGLRGELRHQHLAAGGDGLIHWSTLQVAGPIPAARYSRSAGGLRSRRDNQSHTRLAETA
jgi:hypothetical protein